MTMTRTSWHYELHGDDIVVAKTGHLQHQRPGPGAAVALGEHGSAKMCCRSAARGMSRGYSPERSISPAPGDPFPGDLTDCLAQVEQPLRDLVSSGG
jgi:hypothetical protein